ncbi:MAG: ATP-binding cassette domain-containing protein [Bacteroidota bacterium]|nr:ATP-binding cassette domain-containing protein [Bacteroidota bacterium]
MSNETVIKLDNVSVFQEHSAVVNNINLEVKKGEFVYMIGKTGSGKSSLLKTLYGELPLKQGEATVAGFNLKNVKRKEIPFLRRKLGIVFQDFQLLSDRSVYENLRFVMKATGWKDEAAIKKQIDSVLKKTGLENKGQKMPYELSGGEQQRVSVARALVNSPEIILADEPTGNLDPETSSEIMSLLLDIAKSGTAILFATHDFILYNKFPSRTLKFENGKVEQLG